MRLFFIASILIIQSQLQAQGDYISYRFQVDPKQYTDYNINFTVIDKRADTSNIGKMSQGFDFERLYVKPKPSLQDQLNAVYYKGNAGNRNMILIVNEFTILDNPSESSYLGIIRLSLDLFEMKDNQFKYINSLDTTVIVKGSRLDKLLVSHSASYMLLFINASVKINLNETKSFSYDEMIHFDSTVTNIMPLYRNDILKQGLYKSYQDLLYQKNVIEFDILKACKPKNKKILVIKDGKEQCLFKDSFYALVYHNLAYVNFESKWYKVDFKQNEVTFIGLMLRIDKEYMNGLEFFSMMGITGAIISDAIRNTKAWHKIKISKKSGKPMLIGKSERPNEEALDIDLSKFYQK